MIKNKRLQRIEDQGQDRRNEVWKVRKEATTSKEAKFAIRDNNGVLITDKDEIHNRYVQYYQDLLKPRTPCPDSQDYINEIKHALFYNFQF